MSESIKAEILRLKRERHTQQSAALSLGVHREKLRRLCREHGIRFDNRPAGHRLTRRTMFRGRLRTFTEIARIAEVKPDLVYHRYWRGWRGEELAMTAAKKGVPRDKRERSESAGETA